MSVYENMRNPDLEDSGDLFSLDTKMILCKDVVCTVYNVEEIGKR